MSPWHIWTQTSVVICSNLPTKGDDLLVIGQEDRIILTAGHSLKSPGRLVVLGHISNNFDSMYIIINDSTSTSTSKAKQLNGPAPRWLLSPLCLDHISQPDSCFGSYSLGISSCFGSHTHAQGEYNVVGYCLPDRSWFRGKLFVFNKSNIK